MIHSDGTVSPVASSLTPLLNQIGFPGNFPENFLVAPSTLYAVEQFPNPQSPFKFYELNLTTGAILKSESLVPLSSSGNVHFEPENIDLDAHLLSFLIANTTFENVKIQALSVVTLSLETNTLTVHPLPSHVANDILVPGGLPQYTTTAYVSGDGSLLTYQDRTGTATHNPATWILNLETSQTTRLAPSMNPAFFLGGVDINFSPTNKYAAVTGGGISKVWPEFFIVDTTTGAVLEDIAARFPGVPNLSPMNWAGPTDLVFTSTVTGDPNTEATHVYDLPSGHVTTFSQGLGAFIAVLP